MIKLKIIGIEEYNYILENNNNTCNLNIEFLGDKIPTINDIIYINEKILKEKNLYVYGPLNSKYSRNINVTEEELIKVITPNEEYYLQRYYG